MSRKGHVQFQGECGGVILQSYPAGGGDPSDLSDGSSIHPIVTVQEDSKILMKLMTDVTNYMEKDYQIILIIKKIIKYT